jgi:hypothetical protein
MTHYRLLNSERLAGGFTDLFKVTHNDLTMATAATGQTLTLATLRTGDVIFTGLLLEVKEAFAGCTTLTASLGVDGALTQFLAGTTMKSLACMVPANTVAAYPATATKSFQLAFASPGAGESLVNATAGELWIWATLFRTSDRAILVA